MADRVSRLEQGTPRIDTPRRFDVVVNLTTLAAFVGLVTYALVDLPGFMTLLRKDQWAGISWIEDLTVVVLVPGILIGFFAYFRYRRKLPHPLVGLWLLLWTLASLYFAGEEISWGQWLFHWRTPEVVAAYNGQAETNLHNMSSWLDQKPKNLVELFIVVAGLVIPLWRFGDKDRRVFSRGRLRDWEGWLYAPRCLLAASFAFTVSRCAKWMPSLRTNVGDGEFMELWVALFLTTYLLSYLVRLSGRSAPDS